MLKNRIKEARKHLKISSQKEFALQLNWNIGRVQDLESGKVKELKASEAEEIQDKFLISGWWLLTGKGEMLVKSSNSMPTICECSEDDNSTDLISLNYYPDIVAAAGYGGINDFDIQPCQVMKLDKLFLEDVLNIKHFDNIDVIRVVGDSMEPFIFDGEVVLIERNNEAKNGETIIANINGHVYIKKFSTDPFGRWIKLISDNGRYGEINLEGDQLEFFSIIGIVRAKIKAF